MLLYRTKLLTPITPKILVFIKGGSIDHSWTYNNEILENVDSFNYLGLCLNYNGKFNTTQKKLADQGLVT